MSAYDKYLLVGGTSKIPVIFERNQNDNNYSDISVLFNFNKSATMIETVFLSPNFFFVPYPIWTKITVWSYSKKMEKVS